MLIKVPASLHIKLYSAVENIAYLLVVTSPDGTIEYVNRQFREVTGYSDEEVRGKSINILKSGQQDDKFYARLWNTIKSGNDFHGTFVNRAKSGTLYYEDKVISPIIDHTGTMTGYVSCGQNLSKETNDNEMAKAERLGAAIAHDLRAPLYAIQGFSETLEKDAADCLKGNSMDQLKCIQETSARMQRMITSLLAFPTEDKTELSLEYIDLSNIVRTIANELQVGQPHRDVLLQIAPDIDAVADPVLAEILFQNLLENAWKFTRKKSPAIIKFGTHKGLHGLAYFVQDNGIGFNMEYSYGLFEPFMRLHREADYEGLGMGLATVASIVRRHRGRVWIESAVGKGTTVWFTLVPSIADESSYANHTHQISGY